MVPPAPDAWASGPIAAHSNRVSADCGLRCRETGFPGRRKMRRHVARPTDQRSQRPGGCTRTPPIRGLCNQLREFSANGELRGGGGRHDRTGLHLKFHRNFHRKHRKLRGQQRGTFPGPLYNQKGKFGIIKHLYSSEIGVNILRNRRMTHGSGPPLSCHRHDLGGGRTYTRQKGELLHPQHEPAQVLMELKREMGPIAFSAQYQQSPIPPGGTIIKRKWLTTYDDVSYQPGDRIIMSWDIALSEAETGDYSACVVLLNRKEIFYIVEVVRGRFPFEMLKQKVMEVKRRYDSSTLVIEDSPISRGLIQSLREQSINVTTYKPDTDKLARVIAQTDLFAGGSVRFPRCAAWLEECIAEILAFPGRHDDQVDALLAWGRQRNLVPRMQLAGY